VNIFFTHANGLTNKLTAPYLQVLQPLQL